MGTARGGEPGLEQILASLARAQRHGFVGPTSIEAQVARAVRLADVLAPAPDTALDLGCGGGIPGLVLARCWPHARLGLLEVGRRRCDLLREAVRDLDLGGRVTVLEGRAEALAHEPRQRERWGLVVAQAFGAPPVTAECGAGFVRVGGRLAVTEPPHPDGTRWPIAGVERLGLAAPRLLSAPELHVAVLEKVELTNARFPRRVGVPAHRPLW